MIVGIIPESDRKGRAVGQSWLLVHELWAKVKCDTSPFRFELGMHVFHISSIVYNSGQTSAPEVHCASLLKP